MEGAWGSTSCWLVTLVLAMGRVAASCCVPGSLVTLSEASMLPVPCPVSWCGGWLQACHWMPATILLLAAGLVSWTGMVPSPASCRLLPFVTIFCCYSVFSLTDVDAVFSFNSLCLCFYTHSWVNASGRWGWGYSLGWECFRANACFRAMRVGVFIGVGMLLQGDEGGGIHWGGNAASGQWGYLWIRALGWECFRACCGGPHHTVLNLCIY